ncbi:hypothetical protein [Azospirillum argentinense]|uniref:hypothetical protein n=1 Tax=Azospirillum argentinense TaxID=2970906 RepID=UPI001FFF1B7B|nr:hypothetical protein [Azospirillum argentinense]
MSQLPSRHARRARATSPKMHRPLDRRSLVLRSGIVALMAACGVVMADLADAQQPPPPTPQANAAPPFGATGPEQGGGWKSSFHLRDRHPERPQESRRTPRSFWERTPSPSTRRTAS